MSWLVGGPLAYQREREVLKRHDSTPHGSWLRQKYEEHRRAYPVVEDAFDLPPTTRESLFRRLDEMARAVMPPPPVSDYVPEMAVQVYGDGSLRARLVNPAYGLSGDDDGA